MFSAVWTAFYCPLGDGLEIEINHRTRSTILDGPQTAIDDSPQTRAGDRAADLD